jgi:hypothetical protein
VAYSYADRRRLWIAKLRAAGIDPGSNPRATWEALDSGAQQYATNAYARQHPDYRGGGTGARPTRRAKPKAKAKARWHRKDGSDDIYWSTDLRRLRAVLNKAGRRRASMLGTFWVRNNNTGQEGWRQLWVGDPPPEGSDFEVLDGPDGKVQLTVGPSGGHPSRLFRAALRGRSDIAQALIDILNAGGF